MIHAFAVGDTIVVILEQVIIAILAGLESDQTAAIEQASYYQAELAFIQALPDGRDVAVFERIAT